MDDIPSVFRFFIKEKWIRSTYFWTHSSLEIIFNEPLYSLHVSNPCPRPICWLTGGYQLSLYIYIYYFCFERSSYCILEGPTISMAGLSDAFSVPDSSPCLKESHENSCPVGMLPSQLHCLSTCIQGQSLPERKAAKEDGNWPCLWEQLLLTSPSISFLWCFLSPAYFISRFLHTLHQIHQLSLLWLDSIFFSTMHK